MPVFLLKSFLSLVMLLFVFIAMGTMFEVLGRAEKRYNIETLKKIHRINGAAFFLLFVLISAVCIAFLVNTKEEPSARGAFHSVFAVAVIVLFLMKVGFVRTYRQFYGKVPTMGLGIALLSFLLFGTSGGYYLIVTKFGADTESLQLKETGEHGATQGAVSEPAAGKTMPVRTDPASIARGKELYESKCYFCHDAGSTKRGIGPGHKGILKNPRLPASGRPATPDNVRLQLRRPYKDMPPFAYLSEGEVEDLVSYLDTL